MEIQAAVAKVGKYATHESGDTLEMIERPRGGLSLVLVDGQHTGRGAKAVSNLVARKALGLLAEGVRDGAAARAAHDSLYTQYEGKVQASLTIVSIDLASKTLLITRNNSQPVYIVRPDSVVALDAVCHPVGLYRHTRPAIAEMPLEPHTVAVVYTDGLSSAGVRRGEPFNVHAAVQKLHAEGLATAQTWADRLLAEALQRDDGRASDDISVLIVAVLPRQSPDEARRMLVRMPL